MDQSITNLISSGMIFEKISDIIRVVDPRTKRVIFSKNNSAGGPEPHCFDFWGKNKACDNCISIRAYNDDATYVKIEYTQEKIFMITAIPYDFSGKKVIIEILKDMTNSIFFSPGDSVELTGVHALIDHMNEIAFSDSLTGLYNRRYISEKLPVDLLNSALLSREVSIILTDIDFFKEVNDHFGHIAGDQVLKYTASVLSDCLKRGSDWVARYGGEEFLICMPGAALEVAKSAAERMRVSLENAVIPYEGNEIRVTASFGVVNIKPTGNEILDSLVKKADEKLYLAKQNGRNAVAY
jgi:diguanylate cyclase (GGDEF)-like protein